MQRKRVISLLLSLVMLISIAFSGFSPKAKAMGNEYRQVRKQISLKDKQALTDYLNSQTQAIKDYDKKVASEQINGQVISDDNNSPEKEVKEDEEVRIIVELSGKSAFEMAKEAKIPLNQANKFTTKVANAQKKNISEVKKVGKVRHTYQNLINGFSAVVQFKDIDKVREMPGVKKVTVAKKYYLDMKTAGDFTQAKTTWEKAGLKGEGIVVAIIDTGVDYTHKDMKISNPLKAKYNKEKVDALIQKYNAKGKFFTDKVPYGYNFADMNQEVIDKSGSMHGMHVGGIVAANGEITGVAPEAQLLAMKVFSNNRVQRSAFNDDIAAGVEEAWRLGADVINMSLGSPSGFATESDPEQMAIKNATEAGVVVVVSAGNSAYSTNGFDLPYEKDCDISMLGDPGLYKDSLQVASSENSNTILLGLEYKTTEKNGIVPYTVSDDDIDPLTVLKGEYSIVDCGFGTKEELADKNLTGKIALVQRGGKSNFVEKKLNTQNKGAEGIIVYNKDGDNSLLYMASSEDVFIPALFIKNSDGKNLKELISSGVKVFFRGRTTTMINEKSAQMSDFSSWGTTPDLKFKPEVTAPGGQIYSTVNDNKYQTMSGTSMSAPHTSGVVALVVQYMKKSMPDLTGRDFVNLAKTLVINTSKPIIEKKTNLPYLTRKQGAGMVQTYDAITTKVYALANNESAVASLGEVNDGSSFSITLKNFGDKDATFKVKDNYGVLTNAISDDEIPRLLPETAVFDAAKVSFDKNEITIPKGQTASITVKLDFSIKPNNQFAEGFITFESVDGSNPNLGVPYMGFFGKWDEPRIFDSPKWEKDSFYKGTTLTDGKSFLDDRTEGKVENIAFSPNGDETQDMVFPLVSLLRNAKQVKVDILNKDKDIIRNISVDNDIRRNNGTQQYPFIYSQGWGWDGKRYNSNTGAFEAVPEGQYYVRVAGKVDYKGAREQEIVMPIKVDNTAPTIDPEFTKLEGNKYKVKFNGNDNMAVCYKIVIVNGDFSHPLAVTDEYDEIQMVLPSGYNLVSVIATDFAGNFSEQVDYYVNNTFIDIYPNWEKPYVKLNTNELEVEYIGNSLFEGLATISVTLDDSRTDNLPLTGKYLIEGLSDGEHTIKFELMGNDGKVIGVRMHKLLVDTKNPVITMIDPLVDRVMLPAGQDCYYFKFKAEDENLVGCLVNGNVAEEKDGYFEGRAFVYPNESPEEEVLIVAVDECGNVAEKTIILDCSASIEEPKEPGDTLDNKWGLKINLEQPVDITKPVTTKSLYVSGTLDYDYDLNSVKVYVNDQQAFCRRGRFSTTINFDGYGEKTVTIKAIDESDNTGTTKTFKVNLAMISVPTEINTSQLNYKLDYDFDSTHPELDHVNIKLNAEDTVNNEKNKSIELKNLDYGLNIVIIDLCRADGSIIESATANINVDIEPPILIKVLDTSEYDVLENGTMVDKDKISLRGFLSEQVKYAKVNDVEQTLDYYNNPGLNNGSQYFFNVKDIPLNEGMNLVRITIEDMVGNINDYVLKIIRDSKAPELELLNIATEQVTCNEDTYALKIKARDDQGYKLSVNGNEILSTRTEGNNPDETLREIEYSVQLKDGENIVTVEAKDLLGHKTTKTVKILKNVDKPLVTVFTTDVLNKKVTITGKIYNITKLIDKELGKEIEIKEDGTFTYERLYESYGKNKEIVFAGLDATGNEIAGKTVNFDVNETNAPVLVVTSPKVGTTVNNNMVMVTGTVKDESAFILTINGEEVAVDKDGAFSYKLIFDSYGKNTIEVKAVDVNGIRSYQKIDVNVVKPYVDNMAITLAKNEVFTGGTVAVKLTANYTDGKVVDATKDATWTCDYGKIVNGVYTAPVNYNGKVVIRATYEGKTSEYTLVVKENTIKELKVTADKTSIYVGSTVKLTAIATYADGKTEDVTNKINWSIIGNNLGSINNGIFTAKTAGNAVITGQYGKVSTNVVSVKITNLPVKKMVVVTGNRVWVRSRATTKASRLGLVRRGYKMEYLGYTNGWYKVRYNGKIGYISARYTKVQNASVNSTSTTVKKMVRVTGRGVWVRSGATTRASKRGLVRRDYKMEYLGYTNGWYKVRYNGKIGYISARYSKIN